MHTAEIFKIHFSLMLRYGKIKMWVTNLVSYKYDAWGNTTTDYFNGGASTKAADNPVMFTDESGDWPEFVNDLMPSWVAEAIDEWKEESFLYNVIITN